MSDTTCYDCSAPAHEDEGYTFEGQIVCYGCYAEAVMMARIEQDMGAEYEEGAVYSCEQGEHAIRHGFNL
tara:strand:+ start:717 stop:926 length:210 start_codon:yes stop_codon:yes gene_type:complete